MRTFSEVAIAAVTTFYVVYSRSGTVLQRDVNTLLQGTVRWSCWRTVLMVPTAAVRLMLVTSSWTEMWFGRDRGAEVVPIHVALTRYWSIHLAAQYSSHAALTRIVRVPPQDSYATTYSTWTTAVLLSEWRLTIHSGDCPMLCQLWDTSELMSMTYSIEDLSRSLHRKATGPRPCLARLVMTQKATERQQASMPLLQVYTLHKKYVRSMW